MTPEQFMYWLSGLLEDSRIKALDETQLKMVREHMALVMTKVTGDAAKAQDELTKLLQTTRTYQPTALIC